MKFLGIFGLVGTLCTFAIMAYMWSKMADTYGPHIKKVNKNPKKVVEGHTRPMKHGAEVMLASQLKVAFLQYLTQRGDFPSSSNLPSARSSNDFLREVLKKNRGLPEKSFYFFGSFITKSPGDENTSQNNALSAGENHWAYVRGSKRIGHYTNVPLLIEPYRPGENSYRQADYGSGRGVLVMFSDGSVRIAQINSEGHPVINGKNILSTEYFGWKGETPTIYQPLP